MRILMLLCCLVCFQSFSANLKCSADDRSVIYLKMFEGSTRPRFSFLKKSNFKSKYIPEMFSHFSERSTEKFLYKEIEIRNKKIQVVFNKEKRTLKINEKDKHHLFPSLDLAAKCFIEV